MMKNKNAWLKIMEAFLAIVIIIGALVIIISNQRTPASSENIYETQRQILELISNDEDARTQILDSRSLIKAEKIVEQIVPQWTGNYALIICDLNVVCNIDYHENVYAEEILITANDNTYNPVRLKFFVWFD